MLYLLIFVAKLIEVTMATIRNVLINRGEKLKGSFIAFFEILIWIYVVGAVLENVTEDPLKVVVYALAFTLGNYLGATIENKLAIGTACIQVVIKSDIKGILSDALREKGFGVTIMQGQGKTGEVDLMMIYLKRKRLDEATAIVNEYSPDAMIVINDVRNLKNGFIKK